MLELSGDILLKKTYTFVIYSSKLSKNGVSKIRPNLDGFLKPRFCYKTGQKVPFLAIFASF